MIFNTTSAEVLDHSLSLSPNHAFIKQLGFGLFGLVIGFVAFRFGWERAIRFAPTLLFVFSILLLLCLIPGVGRMVNGSRRWLVLGGFSFQPSEFVKYLIPAFFIYSASIVKGELSFQNLLRIIAWISVPLLLILVEPNNGTACVIMISVLVLLFLYQIPVRYWAWPLAIVIAIGTISASQLPYVRGRLKVYWNPELDIHGRGHQPLQAKIAAGSGGLFGKGPGNSLQKLSYLPEAQNDYIAAIFAEEFGFVGMMGLITLYFFISLFGFMIASNAKNREAAFLAMSITFLISFQAFLNLGVVSGLLPSTGLNLPFFSQGGTSLFANSSALGLLYSVGYES